MHTFSGSWITFGAFAALPPCDTTKYAHSDDPLRNMHTLFRKRFVCGAVQKATCYISADDYYKLYVNGVFVGSGPAPAYPDSYGYNEYDITAYLHAGENVFAAHTYYQGLCNRVWVSGDQRLGLIADVVIDGQTAVQTDESFVVCVSEAYTGTRTMGYETQFAEDYDSRAADVGFMRPDFDDTDWPHAERAQYARYTFAARHTALMRETIRPVHIERIGNVLRADFGKIYAGYLCVDARGTRDSFVLVRCGQEKTADGSVRYDMRCGCRYEEKWVLSGKEDTLDWFDYKAFRYAELVLPPDCTVSDVSLTARHYPFAPVRGMRPEYDADPSLRAVWDMCLHTLCYAVQEVPQDCPDREKGFYLGDACYTTLTHAVLTGNDALMRICIEDAFRSARVNRTPTACLDCSLVQEIAEFPLMLIETVLWHYRLFGDTAFLRENYPKAIAVLEAYRAAYESNGLIGKIDKWCVVEWPDTYRNGYAVPLPQNGVCEEPHVAANAYYIRAVQAANRMAARLGLPPYRDESPLLRAFTDAFFDASEHLFTDGIQQTHKSYTGNLFPFAFGLCQDEDYLRTMFDMIRDKGIHSVSLFGAFLVLRGLLRYGREDLLREQLQSDGAWLRMLREGATTTMEAWGKDEKWNTSLCHVTFSYASAFMADIDLRSILQ